MKFIKILLLITVVLFITNVTSIQTNTNGRKLVSKTYMEEQDATDVPTPDMDTNTPDTDDAISESSNDSSGSSESGDSGI